MTKLLISANVCFFLYQALQGAAENPTQFVEVGALSSQLLQEGEWWRLFTAQFLHWGVLHLFCNMLGLWFLGPPTESLLGSFRFLGAYLACGTLGMLIAYGFSLLSPDPHPIVLLGASASVLGLVGKAQLSSMLQIVVLQAIFDTMVPEVSSTAHTGGAAVGFLIGLVASSSMMRARQPLSH
jgi:rhomboid protease GluP